MCASDVIFAHYYVTSRDLMVPRYIRRLRKQKCISEHEVLAIYSAFLLAIKAEDQLLEFLSYLPEDKGMICYRDFWF